MVGNYPHTDSVCEQTNEAPLCGAGLGAPPSFAACFVFASDNFQREKGSFMERGAPAVCDWLQLLGWFCLYSPQPGLRVGPESSVSQQWHLSWESSQHLS